MPQALGHSAHPCASGPQALGSMLISQLGKARRRAACLCGGGLGADPRLCASSGQRAPAGSDGQKGTKSTARGLARGRGRRRGSQCSGAPRLAPDPSPGTRGAPGPLTPDWGYAFKTGPGAGALTPQEEEAGPEQVA